MANQIKFFIDPIGNTLSMWLDDSRKETHSEMNEHEDILMLDKDENLIGFEKLNFLPEEFINRLRLPASQRIQGELMLTNGQT